MIVKLFLIIFINLSLIFCYYIKNIFIRTILINNNVLYKKNGNFNRYYVDHWLL